MVIRKVKGMAVIFGNKQEWHEDQQQHKDKRAVYQQAVITQRAFIAKQVRQW